MDLVYRPELTDQGLADEAPMVRAEMVRRLEALWSACLPHIAGEDKPDVRFVEAGIRIVDRMSRLFRLDAPGRTEPDAGVAGDTVSMVLEILAAAEARNGPAAP
jgi:hypothetical protein